MGQFVGQADHFFFRKPSWRRRPGVAVRGDNFRELCKSQLREQFRAPYFVLRSAFADIMEKCRIVQEIQIQPVAMAIQFPPQHRG